MILFILILSRPTVDKVHNLLDELNHFGISSLYINPLKPSGNCMYHLLKQSVTLHFAHRVYLCVFYNSHNKQQLFP
jgi:hypothetical protein